MTKGASSVDACSRVENLFGEKLVYALCPASPHSRQDVVALVQELSSRYPIAKFWLE